ncbi:hypothetical protein I8J32_000555 [Lysobacter solisilvae]|uniref:Methyl-accepting chemotaxis protein n=1 Tax=Agrilutibacter solisilvae TaxID=2763317 RepID=A0A975AS27_9GAMM|nr:hypothetical protein I8J32_000555 [Lysobacter solisilvae]
MNPKGRGLGVNTWLTVLGISVAIFGLNAGYATWKGGRLANASSSASALQVNSQRLAVQGAEAVSGDKEAYAAFKATKSQMDSDVNDLNSRFGNELGVSGEIGTVSNTWELVGRNADLVIASEAAVTGLAQNADSFASKVPQLQARLDELVRAMSSSGSPASQVYLALRQNVLAGAMDKSITSMRAGGPGASVAGEQLRRNASVFGNVLAGLRKGDATLSITPLSNGGALAALGQAETLWTDMKKDLDAILAGSKNLFTAQGAASTITNESNTLLSQSQSLFNSLTAFGSVTSKNPLGHILGVDPLGPGGDHRHRRPAVLAEPRAAEALPDHQGTERP